MTEQEQETLKIILKSNSIWWAPDESTCYWVVSITLRPKEDECGLCANFHNGKYAALEGCEINQFIVGSRLKSTI